MAFRLQFRNEGSRAPLSILAEQGGHGILHWIDHLQPVESTARLNQIPPWQPSHPSKPS